MFFVPLLKNCTTKNSCQSPAANVAILKSPLLIYFSMLVNVLVLTPDLLLLKN